MPYDQELGQRARAILANPLPIQEKHMFGGLCWLIEGRMFAGLVGDSLMVRVGPDQLTECLQRPHARPMDFTGRPLKGFVFVGLDGLQSDAELAAWLHQGLAYATTLPLPAPKTARSKGKKA